MHCQISLKFGKLIHYGSEEEATCQTGTGSRNEPPAAAIVRRSFVLSSNLSVSDDGQLSD